MPLINPPIIWHINFVSGLNWGMINKQLFPRIYNLPLLLNLPTCVSEFACQTAIATVTANIRFKGNA
jgi:hypothetical protein